MSLQGVRKVRYYGTMYVGNGRSRSRYAMGDPGFFSGIGKVLGTVAKGALNIAGSINPALGVISGLVQGGAATKSALGPAPVYTGLPGLPVLPGPPASVYGPPPPQRLGPAGPVALGPPRGQPVHAAWYKKDGTPRRIRKDGRPWKRPSMNVSNSHAAARAVRRISGARRLLKSIESTLPRRACKCSTKRR